MSTSATKASPPTHHPHEQAHSQLNSVMSSCLPITLKFVDMCYRVKTTTDVNNAACCGGLKRIFCSERTSCDQGSTTTPSVVHERTILHGISGMASPGEILAILGPSGSGKSTLLNALAGRLHGSGLTGAILANEEKRSKAVLKRTGFVTQDDVLYPHLTVRETLVFCSLLRLPQKLSRDDKIRVAESVISELGLVKCEDTIIGNSFVRGVSGGERKRVSIAHEMLINPSLLILDEPTSGLDSTAAHRLMNTLSSLAKKGKTIVTSMHQPSSRVYQMFDSVLVLSEGRSIYYGRGCEVMSYFDSVGFRPSFPMNPADFLLDLANGIGHVDGHGERDRPSVKQALISSYNSVLAPKVKVSVEGTMVAPRRLLNVGNNTLIPCRGQQNSCLSSWFNQFSILLQRSLKERKHESFDSLRVFQVVAASLLAASMWWHSDPRDIQDRLGLLFFITIFWGVLPSFNSTFAFPQERAIFMKERSSGMYTLSSYFMARIIGDLPMELILPTVFISITYWLTGLKPELGAFLLTLLVLLSYVLVSQGLGLALGAAIMDAKKASTIVTVTMLAFVLTGGFYVHKVPSCLSWIKYLSTTYYSYRLLINVQYGDGQALSSMFGCLDNIGTVSATCKAIEEDISGQIHPLNCVMVMFVMLVGYRLLAYLALGRFKA
ncbi:unnamed protein product [Rhodiola kirilowii]